MTTKSGKPTKLRDLLDRALAKADKTAKAVKSLGEKAGEGAATIAVETATGLGEGGR